MDRPASPGRPSLRSRRGLALALLPLVCLPALLTSQQLASASPPPRSQSLEELRLRESEAAGDLENSSRQVKAAAASLREVAAQLPAAEQAVAKAKGELAGARAKAAAAAEAVRRAEAARVAAQGRVAEANERVEEGREDAGRLARRAYQRGRLGDLQEVMAAAEPQDLVRRADMLRSLFRAQSHSLDQLSRDRIDLAATQADLAAEERELDSLREQAEEDAARIREVAVAAEQAAQRVADLVAQRKLALSVAEANREQDRRDYAAAQAASEALAERIRAAAAKAAAERAAAEKRAKAAAEAERKKRAREGKKPAPQQAEPRNGKMLWPAPGRLTSRYGWRTHPIYGDRRFHAGIDIGGGLGARVSAADPGIVTYAGYAGGYGTLVVVSHRTVGGRDLSTAYAHMGELTVREGQSVRRGDKLGEIGNEGNSTGPHLHFEVRLGGDPVDPLDYVDPP